MWVRILHEKLVLSLSSILGTGGIWAVNSGVENLAYIQIVAGPIPAPPTKKETMNNLTDNAKLVLERRYLKKDDDGNVIEKPEDLFSRVAYNVASAGKQYGLDDTKIYLNADKYYVCMRNLDFVIYYIGFCARWSSF